VSVIPTLTITASIREMLSPAVKAGRHSWSQIEASLADGTACIWATSHGCVLTQVDEQNVCDVVLGGGWNARSWIYEVELVVRAHPAHVGVERYRIWGRKGWRRLFPHWRFVGFEDGLAVLESDA
jgi:hypothetical protein